MSYTVCIVKPTVPHGDQDAWRHLHGLLARRDDERALPPAPVFLELIDRLTRRFPCTCDLADEEENGLWSDEPLRNNAEHSVAVLGLVNDRVEDGLPFVVETANALALIVFDQQTGKIHRPATAPSRLASDSASATYRVVIRGVHEAYELDRVVASLVPLFKRPAHEVRLMLDSRAIVRQGVGKSAARLYQEALELHGCLCAVEPDTAERSAPLPHDVGPGLPASAAPEDAAGQVTLCEEKHGGTHDEEPAVARYRDAAELGDADAQARLGLAYLKGEGIGRDPAWAFSWLRKAAAQNNAEAQYWLGYVAEKPAPFQAIDWYRKAAQQDHVEAQIRLTVMYSVNGAPYEDQVQASAWYRKLADQGYAGAQYMLGLRHMMGQGVSQDRAQAVGWLQKAARQDHAGAKLQLDKLLHSMDGCSGKKAHKPFWKFW